MKNALQIVVIVLIFSFSGFSQTIEDDSLALVNLYNNTGGVNWTKKTNWLTGRVSTWYGVTVTNGRVMSLELSSNNLQGGLTSPLNLTNLKTLSLHRNKITAIDISKLSALAELTLLSNQISSFVTNTNPDFYKDLSKLQLQSNKITTLNIANMPALAICYVYSNLLQSFITNNSIGYYSFLKDLRAYSNNLSSVDVIGMPSMEVISLYNNQLTFFDITNLRNLQLCHLYKNRLTSFATNSTPDYYSDLTDFQIGYNDLSGIDISNMPALIHFSIGYTPKLTQVSTNPNRGYYYQMDNFSIGYTHVSLVDIGAMQTATQLYLQGCSLISIDLSGFDKLKLIRIFNNKIKRLDITDLKSIEVFQAYRNQVTELVTNSADNYYSKLTELQLQNNQLTSLDISNFPLIEICDARENKISNFITNSHPDYYQKLKNLSLSYNEFSKIDISNMPALITCALGAKVNSGNINLKRNLNFTQLITNPTPEYYYQMSYLGFAYTGVSSVDLRGMGMLKETHFYYSDLASLDFTNNRQIEKVYANNCKLASIILSPSIKDLNVDVNNLTYLDISDCSLLVKLLATENNLTSFNTNASFEYKHLSELRLSFNQLSKVDISLMPALKTCALGARKRGVPSLIPNENLVEIKTNPLPEYYYQIDYLGFSDSQMSTIDLTGMENLKELNAPNCKISSLNLSNLNSLQKITITNNYLTFEDFEPIISKAIPTRIFFPQNNITLFYNPSSYTFLVRVGGTNNKYQWRKNGVNIAGATSSSYTITANDYNRNAQYQCVITNTLVTGLTLYSAIKRPQDTFTDLSTAYYISKTSGNWSDNTTWQLFDGTGYIDAQAGEIPNENNPVYLQANHTITLNTSSSCKDLHLNAAGDVMRLNTGENTLDVYGKIRTYTGTVPGTNSTSAGIPNWITTGTNGRIRLKGVTNRVITEKDEFSDHENLKGWTLECSLEEGVVGTINSNFRAGNVIITSGNLEVKSKNFKVSR